MKDQQKITNLGSSTFGYQGTLKVEKCRNRKAISTAEYHNQGTNLFFKNLCAQVAGDRSAIITPAFIRLYALDANQLANTSPRNLTLSDLREATPVSPFWRVTDASVVTSGSNAEDVKAKTHFQFVLPYAVIQTGTLVHIMALHCTDNAGLDVADNTLAFYAVSADGERWDDLQISSGSSAYTLAIDWLMEFSNTSTRKEY